MTVNYGQQGTETVLASNRFFDVDDLVFLTEPDESPFTSLMIALGRTQQRIGDPRFQWFNKDKRADAIDVDGAHTDSDVTILVDDATLFVPNDVLQVITVTTGVFTEKMLVVSVDTATKLVTVVREVAGTTKVALNDNDQLFRIGNAHPEGSDNPPPVSQRLNEYFNFAQIFRHSVIYSKTFDHADKFHAGLQNKELQRRSEEKRKEHVREIEKANIFGSRGIDNAGTSNVRRYCGGLQWFIDQAIANGTDNTEAVAGGGALTYPVFDAFLGNKLFNFGGKEKWALCSTNTISVLNELTRDFIRIKSGSTSFGLNIDTFISPHGTLHLVRHDMLAFGTYANSLIGFDPDHMSIEYMRGSVTEFAHDIGLPSKDSIEDGYITEQGLKVRVPETLSLMTNIVSAA